MPLTEQEKLLLRIAHRGDPVEVAMLDPNQRSLEEMKEKAEYQSFFARPVIKQPMEQGAEQATPTADSASDPAEEKQVEEQQQMPSSEDNKNNNDNSKSNGKKKGETE
jgi:deoxyadenosine/deoxycytidine kinase